ncbi:MAG: FAA hydrolase family protein [Brevundimonas sp.]|uniref:fumarylacetoacetate hydrolase family protein n=1 Tax=unclassified Brevundimonas TaxID=2622653 RepID=UPI0006D05D9A|nr:MULTISPECIES: fumarylacetoacetate hydrolase family protein [unclassified Brevundimonas]ALJ06958.1 fumarylacetoacetase [Brevundimonas sp. DS20]PZU60440.1 MAG: FAA hydrolase family protein [Brevundimonas sp.]
MVTFTHPLDPPVLTRVEASDQLYPVHRIFCVGRNYAAHAREMGRDPDREPPFFFTKSIDTLVPSGEPITYPPETANFHYEMELVVALGRDVFRADESEATSAIFGFACGLDMTRRDLQLKARAEGRPWDTGKSFEQSTVLAPIRAMKGEVLRSGPITLSVNDDTRQSSDLDQLIWSVPEIIAELSRYYSLQAGDLIFTGTPEGVGAVVPGDQLEGRIADLPLVSTTILPPRP